jgi:hypothetical protein
MSWFWFVLLVVVPFVLERFIAPKRVARKIVADSKALYSAPHEIVEVSAATFRDLDHRFYDNTRAELESLGFQYFADIEDLTLSRQYPSMRTFIRVLTGDEGTISAGIYQLKFRRFYRLLQLVGMLARKPFFVDLETEFSDGTFVATSNTTGTDLSSPVPEIHRYRLPQAVPVAQLLVVHRAQIEVRRQNGLIPTQLRSLAEVRAMQDRIQHAKNRHKQSIGFVDAEMTAKIAATVGDKEKNYELARELKVLRDKNLAASAVNVRS